MLHGRPGEDRPPADRCEQQVLDVWLLDRDRPAACTGAQTDGERERHHRADHRGGQPHDVGNLGVVQLGVAHNVGEECHGDDGHQRDDVHLVREFEPLERDEPLATAGIPERADRCVVLCSGGHHVATLASSGRRRRSARSTTAVRSARAGGNGSARVAAPARPTGHEESRGPEPGVLDREDISTRGHAGPAVTDNLDRVRHAQ